MTFCHNNNLFSNLPCPDWMQSPSKFLKGAPPKGRTLFNHVVISYANLLDQKKVLNGKMFISHRNGSVHQNGHRFIVLGHKGCVRLGNLDLDYKILISDL